MEQLKVGDRVRRVAVSCLGFLKGSIHTVASVGESGLYFYVTSNNNWKCSTSELYWELIEEEEEMKDMELKDLTAGMRVELRDGTQCLVVKCGVSLSLLTNKSHVFELRTWHTDLTSVVNGSNRDIMKVWDCYYSAHATCDLSKELPSWPTWEREEVKELTVAEIEKLLGHSVKIVK